MLCSNGLLGKPKGETGIYFLCQLDFRKDSPCPFAKWCSREQTYKMATDMNGSVCEFFTVDTKQI